VTSGRYVCVSALSGDRPNCIARSLPNRIIKRTVGVWRGEQSDEGTFDTGDDVGVVDSVW
jgi:hypothetical protein